MTLAATAAQNHQDVTAIPMNAPMIDPQSWRSLGLHRSDTVHTREGPQWGQAASGLSGRVQQIAARCQPHHATKQPEGAESWQPRNLHLHSVDTQSECERFEAASFLHLQAVWLHGKVSI